VDGSRDFSKIFFMQSINRRHFLKQASLAGAAVGFPAIIPSGLLGENAPSKRIHIGAIGVGSRSKIVNLHNIAKKFADARIIACADPFRGRREGFAESVNELYGGNYCTPYRDFRELLNRDDIDGVTICTGDHWHVPLAIAAIRAGKDVYVEKPLSTALTWAWQLRKEAAKRDVVFQYGTQQRSMRQFQQAVDLVRNGYIGKVEKVDVWCSNMDKDINAGGLSEPYGSTKTASVPDGIDYDLWIGPAPMRPYTVDRTTNYVTWHNYDYALGFIAGWGAHPLDAAQWGLDADHTSPVYYEGSGSLPPEGGLYNTTRYWDIRCRYANGVSMHFMDHKTAAPRVREYHYVVREHGTVFHGEDGWIGVDRSAMYSHDRNKLRRVEFKASDERVLNSSNQQRNFIDCIKSRQPTISPLESAIRSDTISHLADIVVRTGEPLGWDPVKERIISGSSEQEDLLHREPREKWSFFL
jgi:predicted dehydrogenase